MPIDLTNISENNAAGQIVYSPKFFNKDFTGTGMTSGLLKQSLNPLNANITPNDLSEEDYILSTDWFDTNRNVDSTASYDYIYQNVNPFCNVINYLDKINEYPSQDYLTDWCELTDSYAVRVIPYIVRIKVKMPKLAYAKTTRSALVSYLVQVKNTNKLLPDSKYTFTDPVRFSAIDQDDADAFIADYDLAYQHLNNNTITNILTCTPKTIFNSIIKDLNLNKQAYQKAKTYFDDLSIYDMLSILSENYQKHIVKYFDILYHASAHPNAIANLLDIINNLRLPLDQYKEIYQFIKTNIKDQDKANSLFDLNLNLKFNRLLSQLNQEKPNLVVNQNTAKTNPRLSTSQRNAVTTKGPLSLIEAGAGTGKSSVISNKIKYLTDSGVEPKDILILSFTNAAADHIKEIHPGVHSMTINTLVNTIYSSDQPGQSIVSDKTFYNTLLINYKDTANDYMKRFIKAARYLTMRPDETGVNYLDEGFKLMSNVIREKPNVALKICQTLGQVTLNMQMLLTYQYLDKFSLPDITQCKYLLVDEVQDNSIFDFMFLLKYTLTQKCNFFIVGDASQTLYAFRNANPRAMNVLESSNVFDIFKLDINFRSRQEILSYANVLLNQTESNIFAKIQLQANNLRKPTVKDFDKNVNLYHMKTKDFHGKDNQKDITSFFMTDGSIKKYIEDCLNRGEKIAFLAYRHDLVNVMRKAVQNLLNTKATADISSRHMSDMTLFSGFWANYSKNRLNLLLTKSPLKILEAIQKSIIWNNPDPDFKAVSDEAVDYKQAKWDDFIRQNSELINKAIAKLNANTITKKQFIKTIMKLSLSYEIGFNRVLQQTAKDRNNTDQKLKAMQENNLIFSTIHSVKGLEFDNVVLLMQTPYRMKDEATKRLYYVGLTRAKNSEYVLLQDSEQMQNSIMTTNYKIARNKFK